MQKKIIIFLIISFYLVGCNSNNTRKEKIRQHIESLFIENQNENQNTSVQNQSGSIYPKEYYKNFNVSELKNLNPNNNNLTNNSIHFYENIDNTIVSNSNLYIQEKEFGFHFYNATIDRTKVLDTIIKIDYSKNYELMVELTKVSCCQTYYFIGLFKGKQNLSFGLHYTYDSDAKSFLFDVSNNGKRYSPKYTVKILENKSHTIRIRKINNYFYCFLDRLFVTSICVDDVAVAKIWNQIGFTSEGHETEMQVHRVKLAYLSLVKQDDKEVTKSKVENKIRELKQFQFTIGNKLKNIIQLIQQQRIEDDKLKREIKEYKVKNKIDTYEEGLKIAGISNDLKLLQESEAIQIKLIESANYVYNSYEDLKFLIRRNERELNIGKVFNKDELQNIISILDTAKVKYLPETKNFVMPNIT